MKKLLLTALVTLLAGNMYASSANANLDGNSLLNDGVKAACKIAKQAASNCKKTQKQTAKENYRKAVTNAKAANVSCVALAETAKNNAISAAAGDRTKITQAKTDFKAAKTICKDTYKTSKADAKNAQFEFLYGQNAQAGGGVLKKGKILGCMSMYQGVATACKITLDAVKP